MKKTTVTQSFPFASLFLVFMALDGVSIRHRMKYKGFNEASLSHTQTHTDSFSFYSPIFLGFVSHCRVLRWRNKTEERQMVSEELLLRGTFTVHSVTQLVSQQVGQHRVRQPGPKPGGQICILTYLFAQQQNKIRNIMKFKCSVKCSEEFPQNHSFKSFFEEFGCSTRVKSL